MVKFHRGHGTLPPPCSRPSRRHYEKKHTLTPDEGV
nr:MAG TPA: hypothetical protein [Caudoviricetes sp.]